MVYDYGDQFSEVLTLSLELSQYPILARRIRECMREELFSRGIITRQVFEEEVLQKAIRTQQREGLGSSPDDEPPDVWEKRLRIVRDDLTDFYFAMNLPHDRFEEIVRGVLRPGQPGEDIILTFNTEAAPWGLLFQQAEQFEKLPPAKRQHVQHHLRQIVAVLTRGMISDEMNTVRVAREHLSVSDLQEVYRRRIGRGKVGGKAAGLLLAYRILQEDDPADPLPICENVTIPESYFLAADVCYDFLCINNLYEFMNQKYKTQDEIEADYPRICKLIDEATFPGAVVERLAQMLDQLGNRPLIVRSSSLLEDNFGVAFAGKYATCFCPNQGTPDENLVALCGAIRQVYASIFNPDAIFYRKKMGLLDYDERMAVLIQEVQGSQYEHYFFPTISGVAFGRNPFRWTPRIRREDGFMRIVLGLGTRAVNRVANDYPRMVALSHPELRPTILPADVCRYSQHFVDVIDLADNSFKTLRLVDLICADYPAIHLLASVSEDDQVRTMLGREPGLPPHTLVLTFDRLLKDHHFIDLMKGIMRKLERAYGLPVDIEFTVEIVPTYPQPRYIFHLLQCRPLSRRTDEASTHIPHVPAEDVLFTSTTLVPEGIVRRIEYVVYVDPNQYRRAPDTQTRQQIARAVGRLNARLAGRRFILVGPGRWGSSNIDLGVGVSYVDIYNTSMLVEVAFAGAEGTPEVSYGTHFFQDLVEANIYPLSLYPDEKGTAFCRAFFEDSPNTLAEFVPQDEHLSPYIRVIRVPQVAGGHLMEVIMNPEEGTAIGYLRSYPLQDEIA